LSRDVHDCSEASLVAIAAELAADLEIGHRVLLEGKLGAGKSTFARALLQSLKVRQPPEGSPTFAIAHEYESSKGVVVHVDFYRLKSELEIDEAGIPAYFWERPTIALCEWLSAHPLFEKAVLESGKCWRVHLEFGKGPELRNLKITAPGS
jgi:tRNA threonylcarbamoyl adenosine modification protein YjeE